MCGLTFLVKPFQLQTCPQKGSKMTYSLVPDRSRGSSRSLCLEDWVCPKSGIETFAIQAMKLIDSDGMLQNGGYRLLAKGMQRLKPENM